MKNTRTIEVWVYTRKIEDSEMPISAENTQNSIWAVAGRSRSIPAEITNTMASGARRVGGHRRHVDAKGGKAGDAEPDRHVVVDAQHVGAQTGIDGRGVNAPRGPAERRSVVAVKVRHGRIPVGCPAERKGLRRRYFESISDRAVCGH